MSQSIESQEKGKAVERARKAYKEASASVRNAAPSLEVLSLMEMHGLTAEDIGADPETIATWQTIRDAFRIAIAQEEQGPFPA